MKNNKKTIMLIGAGGSLGSSICKYIGHKYNIIAVDRCENRLAYIYRMYKFPIYIADVRESNILFDIINEHNVDLVINTAALKHVNSCEMRIEKAIDINIIANLHLVQFLKKNNKNFIFISSDKAIKPANIYALSKQFTDYFVKKEGFKIVRGVNFLNSKGSVIDIWEQQYKEKLPFTLVNQECIRYFITMEQMSYLVETAIENNDKLEFNPEKVYKMSIRLLFDAYIKSKGIKDPQIIPINIGSCEKLIEDLSFEPIIYPLDNVNEIVDLLTKNMEK